jgi:hypothetical protein
MLAETWTTLADMEASRGHRTKAIEYARDLLDKTSDADDPEIARMRAYIADKLKKWH